MGWRESARARRARVGGSTMKLVLMVLAEQARDSVCWPSQAAIAADCELSDRAVRSALDALESAGFIARDARHPNGGRTDMITLRLQSVEMEIPRNVVPGSPRNVVPVTPERGSDKPIKNQYTPLTPQEPVKQVDPSPDRIWIGEDDPAFEAWRREWRARTGRPGPPKEWHPTKNEQGIWRSTRLPPEAAGEMPSTS